MLEGVRCGQVQFGVSSDDDSSLSMIAAGGRSGLSYPDPL